MSDTIALHGIRAFGYHGADEGERERVQPFHVDLELDVALERPRASDDLGDTVDYAALHALVLRIVRERSDRLLERLGDAILQEIMRDERIGRAVLTLAKPGLLAGATPSVRLVRLRFEGGRAEP